MSQFPLDDARIAPDRRPAAPLRREGAATELRPIVLVDDSDIDLFIATQCHARSRIRNPLVVLRGGGAFLAYLDDRRRRKLAPPALVLLDLDMPGLDGLAVLERLRMQEGFSTPVRVMVMSHCDGREHDAQAAGADAFTSKPSTVDGYVQFFEQLPLHWEDVVFIDEPVLAEFDPFVSL